jgi:hypothetical protein
VELVYNKKRVANKISVTATITHMNPTKIK